MYEQKNNENTFADISESNDDDNLTVFDDDDDFGWLDALLVLLLVLRIALTSSVIGKDSKSDTCD